MRFFKESEDAPEPARQTSAEATAATDPAVTMEPTATEAGNEAGKAGNEEKAMSNVQETLNKVMENIQGAIGTALVDFDGGLTLGTAGGGDHLSLDIAGAGCLEVVRAKLRTMESLGLDDRIEDILITLGKQYHLIRPLVSQPAMFLYLAINRQEGNLGMARHQLRALDANLEI